MSECICGCSSSTKMDMLSYRAREHACGRCMASLRVECPLRLKIFPADAGLRYMSVSARARCGVPTRKRAADRSRCQSAPLFAACLLDCARFSLLSFFGKFTLLLWRACTAGDTLKRAANPLIVGKPEVFSVFREEGLKWKHRPREEEQNAHSTSREPPQIEIENFSRWRGMRRPKRSKFSVSAL